MVVHNVYSALSYLPGQCSTIRPRHETSTPQSLPPDGSADHPRYDGVDSQSLFTSSLPAIPLSHDDHLPHLDSKTDTRGSRTMKIKAPLVTTRGAGLTSGGANVDAAAGDVRTSVKYPDSSKHVPILSANNRPLSAKVSGKGVPRWVRVCWEEIRSTLG